MTVVTMSPRKKLKSSHSVLFLGDSNTWGGMVQPEESFPYLVGEALPVTAINSGVFGTNSGSWVPWSSNWVARVNPFDFDAAVVMLGTNDAVKATPVTEYVGNMFVIAASLDADVYLVTPPPDPVHPNLVTLYSIWLKKMGEQVSSVCGVIDNATVLIHPTDFLPDNDLHLNATGHQKLADAIVAELGA